MATTKIRDLTAVTTAAVGDKIPTDQSADNVTRYLTITQILDLLATVSQAEAEAGTATTRRAWTAERVKQAISALAPGTTLPVLAKSANYTLTTSDVRKLIDATANTWTLTLPAAATATDGFWFAVRNSGTGAITIDPNGAELIDGATTLSLSEGQAHLVVCTGSAWKTVGRGDVLDTVAQAEAEAGTATTRRVWTAERVKQAITALVLALDQVGLTDAAAVPSASGRIRRNGNLLQWLIDGSHTNSVLRLLSLIATTSGSPAAGIGTGVLFRSESADEQPSDFGALDFAASDVTAGSEDTYAEVSLRIAGAALAAAYRFAATAAFKAIFTHANSADRTYTLPNTTGGVVINETTAAQARLQSGTVNGTTNTGRTLYVDDGSTVTFATAFAAAPYVWGCGNNGSGMWMTSRNITSTQFVSQPCGIAAGTVQYNWLALGT